MKSLISKKEANAASNGISKSNTKAASMLKKERKTLRACIAQICSSDSEEAAIYRDFLGLQKNATRTEREAAAQWVNNNLIYKAPSVYVSIDEAGCEKREEGGMVACTSTGKLAKDFIDVIKWIKSDHEVRSAKRANIAEQIAAKHRACVTHNTLFQANKAGIRPIDVLINDVTKAPTKRCEAKIFDKIEIRK